MPTYEIIIVANADQAEAVAARLGERLAVTGKEAEAASPKVATLAQMLTGMGPAGLVANSALSDLAGNLTGKLGVGAEAASASITEAEARVAGLGGAGATAAIGVGAAAAAIFAAVEVTMRATDAFVSFAEQVKQVETLTGQTAEQSSVLVTFFKNLGLGVDTASREFVKLSQAIESGKLQKFGVEIAQAKDGTTDLVGTLENLAQKFQETADPAERNAMAMAALGRNAAEAYPLIGRTKEELQAIYNDAQYSTPVLNQEDVNRAEELSVSMRNLSAELNKLWVELGTQVVPAVEDFTNGLTALGQKAAEAPDWFRNIGNVVEKFFTPVWILAGQAIGNFGHDQTVAQQNADAFTASVEHQAHAAHELHLALTEAGKSAMQYANDVLSAESADLRVEEVRQQWADQQKQWAQAVVDAKQAVADAAQNVATVEINNARSIVNAQDAVHAANLRLQQDSLVDVASARTVADAQLRLARIKEDIGSGRLSGVDAIRQEQDASTALARAQDDQATKAAQQQQKIADDQQAVHRAKQNLRDTERSATIALEHATDAQAKAVDNLSKAEAQLGGTELERQKHALELTTALARQHEAHQKIVTDLQTMKTEAEKTNGAFAAMQRTLKAMHVNELPEVRKDMQGLTADIQAAHVAAAAPWTPPGVGGPDGIPAAGASATVGHVTVIVQGSLIGPSAPDVAKALAPHITKAQVAAAASGQILFPKKAIGP